MIPFLSIEGAALYLHLSVDGPCGIFVDSPVGAFGYEYWPSPDVRDPFRGPRCWREGISRILQMEIEDALL